MFIFIISLENYMWKRGNFKSLLHQLFLFVFLFSTMLIVSICVCTSAKLNVLRFLWHKLSYHATHKVHLHDSKDSYKNIYCTGEKKKLHNNYIRDRNILVQRICVIVARCMMNSFIYCINCFCNIFVSLDLSSRALCVCVRVCVSVCFLEYIRIYHYNLIKDRVL